mmetsp:Transcript_565/g.1649  ORF Transcript_565/g.1649 Transcript_565/m.1649 type:complete len:1660 (+) Transcript_565:1067-6046(+)
MSVVSASSSSPSSLGNVSPNPSAAPVTSPANSSSSGGGGGGGGSASHVWKLAHIHAKRVDALAPPRDSAVLQDDELQFRLSGEGLQQSKAQQRLALGSSPLVSPRSSLVATTSIAEDTDLSPDSTPTPPSAVDAEEEQRDPNKSRRKLKKKLERRQTQIPTKKLASSGEPTKVRRPTSEIYPVSPLPSSSSDSTKKQLSTSKDSKRLTTLPEPKPPILRKKKNRNKLARFFSSDTMSTTSGTDTGGSSSSDAASFSERQSRRLSTLVPTGPSSRVPDEVLKITNPANHLDQFLKLFILVPTTRDDKGIVYEETLLQYQFSFDDPLLMVKVKVFEHMDYATHFSPFRVALFSDLGAAQSKGKVFALDDTKPIRSTGLQHGSQLRCIPQKVSKKRPKARGLGQNLRSNPCPLHSFVVGRGISHGIVGFSSSFRVYTCGSDGLPEYVPSENLEVALLKIYVQEGVVRCRPSPVPLSITLTDTATHRGSAYLVRFTPITAGAYLFSLGIGGQQVSGAPSKLTVIDENLGVAELDRLSCTDWSLETARILSRFLRHENYYDRLFNDEMIGFRSSFMQRLMHRHSTILLPALSQFLASDLNKMRLLAGHNYDFLKLLFRQPTWVNHSQVQEFLSRLVARLATNACADGNTATSPLANQFFQFVDMGTILLMLSHKSQYARQCCLEALDCMGPMQIFQEKMRMGLRSRTSNTARLIVNLVRRHIILSSIQVSGNTALAVLGVRVLTHLVKGKVYHCYDMAVLHALTQLVQREDTLLRVVAYECLTAFFAEGASMCTKPFRSLLSGGPLPGGDATPADGAGGLSRAAGDRAPSPRLGSPSGASPSGSGGSGGSASETNDQLGEAGESGSGGPSDELEVDWSFDNLINVLRGSLLACEAPFSWENCGSFRKLQYCEDDSEKPCDTDGQSSAAARSAFSSSDSSVADASPSATRAGAGGTGGMSRMTPQLHAAKKAERAAMDALFVGNFNSQLPEHQLRQNERRALLRLLLTLLTLEGQCASNRDSNPFAAGGEAVNVHPLSSMLLQHASVRRLQQLLRSNDPECQVIVCRLIRSLAGSSAFGISILVHQMLGPLLFRLSMVEEGVCDDSKNYVLEVVGALGSLHSGLGDRNLYLAPSAIYRLFELLTHESTQAQEHASVLLAHLARNPECKSLIVSKGGISFLKRLIDFGLEVRLHNPIEWSELSVGKMIGSGVAGTVHAATWKDLPVAVKCMSPHGIGFTMDEFLLEVAVMSVMAHPRLLAALGACVTPPNLFIVSPLYERGSLAGLLHDPSVPLSLAQRVSFLVDAAEGLSYLHSYGFIHRDVKPDNLLVSEDWRVALTDFGVSRFASRHRRMTRAIGTPLYIAPEVLKGSDYNLRADVYSFAILMAEIVYRQEPFGDTLPMRVPDLVTSGVRPQLLVTRTNPLNELIRQCWGHAPMSRPPMAEVLNRLLSIQLDVTSITEVEWVENFIVDSQNAANAESVEEEEEVTEHSDSEESTDEIPASAKIHHQHLDARKGRSSSIPPPTRIQLQQLKRVASAENPVTKGIGWQSEEFQSPDLEKVLSVRNLKSILETSGELGDIDALLDTCTSVLSDSSADVLSPSQGTVTLSTESTISTEPSTSTTSTELNTSTATTELSTSNTPTEPSSPPKPSTSSEQSASMESDVY